LQSSWNALLNMEEFWMKSLVQGGCCFGCDGDCVLQIFHTRVASQLKSKIVTFLLVCTLHVIVNQFGSCHVGKKTCVYIYIYINKDGKPSTKCTQHVDANVNTWKEIKTIKTVVMKWKM
jgi:hypothetical protein